MATLLRGCGAAAEQSKGCGGGTAAGPIKVQQPQQRGWQRQWRGRGLDREATLGRASGARVGSSARLVTVRVRARTYARASGTRGAGAGTRAGAGAGTGTRGAGAGGGRLVHVE